MPKVTVAILCMNSREHLEPLFQSLKEQTYKDFDTIVSDNGSTDGTVEWLQEHNIRFVANGKNLGFSGGMNIALRNVKTEYVVTLNDDMKLEPRCIEELVKAADADKTIGTIQGKILNWDGTKIDMIGTQITYGSMIARKGVGKPATDFSTSGYIDNAGAGGTLFRMEVLEQIGFFDESFNPAYYEDADLNERIKKAGYKLFYQPTALVYHHHGATLKKMRPQASLSSHRNRYRLLKKHWTTGMWLKALPFLPFITAFYLLKMEKEYFIATWEFLTGKLDQTIWKP